MIGIEKLDRIFIYVLPIDGRLAHRGLAYRVTHTMKHDLLKGDVYLFISGSRRAAKIIIFECTQRRLFGPGG
ncbi:MAG: IS66 family insertion sequence element accessory protein TnpB [Chitinophagaceae bacterium]|nr:IS66 family insertion sequence element accessory protein TnpB [Oligoflexus sp.]